MVYDEGLVQRIREILQDQDQHGVTEKKMFGGVAFFIKGNMCCGVVKEKLMVRVGKDSYEASLQEPNVQKMDFTGKPMRGLIYVEEVGIQEDETLEYWVFKGVIYAESLPAK